MDPQLLPPLGIDQFLILIIIVMLITQAVTQIPRLVVDLLSQEELLDQMDHMRLEPLAQSHILTVVVLPGVEQVVLARITMHTM
jgi:hypothetical protein